MSQNPLIKSFFLLCGITAAVCLSFKYILPVMLPFLLAYIFTHMLQRPIYFLRNKCHFPRFLANSLCFIGFLGGVFSTFLFLSWQLVKQFRLFLSNFPIYRDLYEKELSTSVMDCCQNFDYYFGMQNGTSYMFLQTQTQNIADAYMNTLSDDAGKMITSCFSYGIKICAFTIVLIVGMLTLSKEFHSLQKKFRRHPHYTTIHSILSALKNSGISYLKAEGIIIVINFLISMAALFLIKNPYAILLGLVISLLDALPFIGSGLFFIPWGIYELINKNIVSALILFAAYIATLLVREYLEAKLLSNDMNIPAFFILFSIWIGLKLFGFMGILLGPLAIVLIRALYRTFEDDFVPDGKYADET